MSELADLLDRIRTHVYLNDIHLIEWFEDFDQLRTSTVSKEQFRRCFEFAKFSLTDHEWDLLCQAFERDGDVNYRDFCYQVSQIFTNPDLEHAPKGDIPNSRATVDKVTNRITTDLPPEVDKLFEKLVDQVKVYGIHIKEAFMDFDTHNCGRITKSQFLRALPFRDLSKQEIQILLDRYLDPKIGDVNYKRLHLDIIDFQHLTEAPDMTPHFTLPHQLQSIKLHPLFSDPDTVIERFATYVYKNRVRILDFFRSHDPLHCGRVTQEVFMNVLTLFGFQFSPEELQDLADRYKITIDFTNYSRYKEFCLDVTRAEKAIAQNVPEPPTIDRRAEGILDKIRKFVDQNRLNVLPPFQDFDRTKRGYVTELQFGRVLSILRCPVQPHEVQVLVDIYGGKPDGVDYFRFVEDIDNGHRQQRRAFKPMPSSRKAIEDTYGHTPAGDKFVTPDVADQLIYESKRGLMPKVRENKSMQDLLSDIQKWCYLHSVDLHDFIKDFDPLNTGLVTDNQLRSAILAAGYRFTDDEFDIVTETYRSTRQPDKIEWMKFADDVLAFIASKTLTSRPRDIPTIPKDVMRESRIQQTSGQIPMNQKIESILKKINDYARRRRVSLIEQFRDKDRYNHKQVSTISFAQVMQLIGVHISMNEINLLAEFYMDPETHFVCYPKMVEDVEALGGLTVKEYIEPVVNTSQSYSKEISHIVAQQPKLTAEQLTWNALLPKIQSFVLKRRIRLTQFFENFDRLRHGVVTQQKWNSVVGETNLPIVEDEIQFIGKLFAIEGKPDLFNYRLFVNQVDEIFGPRELHRDPHASGTCRAAYIPDPSLRTTMISNEESRKCDAIIARMHKFVTTRRMEVRQEFEDYDKKPRRNYITRAQFRQCIGRLGLTSDEKELDILCKRYKCTDLDEMNYHAFCNDIGGYQNYDDQGIEWQTPY